MAVGPYSLVDIELIKASPMRWRESDWANIGMCEGALRDPNKATGGRIHLTVHLLIQRARVAHVREGVECPWDDEYRVKPASVPRKPTQCAVSAEELLLAKVHECPRITRTELVAFMTEFGYTEKTSIRTLHNVSTEGLVVRRDGDVGYVVTPSGVHRVALMVSRKDVEPRPGSKINELRDRAAQPSAVQP